MTNISGESDNIYIYFFVGFIGDFLLTRNLHIFSMQLRLRLIKYASICICNKTKKIYSVVVIASKTIFFTLTAHERKTLFSFRHDSFFIVLI